MKAYRVLAWLAFAGLIAAAVLYIIVLVQGYWFAGLCPPPGMSGAHLFSLMDWYLVPSLALVAAAAVCGALFAARGGRRLGMAALVLSLLAGAWYLVIPPQTLVTALYMHYRTFLGINWMPTVERFPSLFPLYRWAFLAGVLLLAVADGLAFREVRSAVRP